MNRKALKTVFLDTVPVLTGYLFLGAGFGILLAEKTPDSFVSDLKDDLNFSLLHLFRN